MAHLSAATRAYRVTTKTTSSVPPVMTSITSAARPSRSHQTTNGGTSTKPISSTRPTRCGRANGRWSRSTLPSTIAATRTAAAPSVAPACSWPSYRALNVKATVPKKTSASTGNARVKMSSAAE